MTDWLSIPKTELHLHLEGAAPPDFIRQLAREKNHDLSGVFDADGGYQYNGFVEFLAVYERATSVLQGPDDYGRLVTAVLDQSAAQNVIYTEIFISPDFCGGYDNGAFAEYFATMQEAVDSANLRHGIETRFIVTCVRHFGPDRAVKAANLAVKHAGDLMVGFGMGGNENHLLPVDFQEAFGRASAAGLPLTNHAGEFAGPESITRSLDDLKVHRIGHGVRAIEDPELVARLADQAIVLEVNPGSNIALGVYSDWHDHPVEILRQAGVPITISTDDPPFFHTDMTHEYKMLAQTFGWSAADFRASNLVAIEAAFCDEQTKAKLRRKLEA